MKFVGFFLCVLSIYFTTAVNGVLLKHLTQPKIGGGIIDAFTRPKAQASPFHLGGGIAFGFGPFGFNFGFQKQIPTATAVNVPGKGNQGPYEVAIYPDSNPSVVKAGFPDANFYLQGGYPYVPAGNPYVPGGNPYVPGGNPYAPGGNPYVPGDRPHEPEGKPYEPERKPGSNWEEDKKVSYNPRPNKDDGEKDYPKPAPHQEEYPKRDPYENDKESRPDWDDIGEETDKKYENFMNGELVEDGFIHPRVNKRRSKRYIGSRIYHIPLIFESNGKPYKVKINSI